MNVDSATVYYHPETDQLYVIEKALYFGDYYATTATDIFHLSEDQLSRFIFIGDL